jgi:tRNA (guanine-N7-)-methyltransferase
MTRETGSTPPPRPGGEKLHGRRKGRPLRPEQQRALDALRPRVSIPAPGPDAALDPARVFAAPPREIWLEIGFGAGEHLIAQAEANPDVGLIGAEVFQDGVAKMLRHLEKSGADNVRLWEDDARDLLTALPEASIARAFILFPDPWPKTKHHKRRIVQKAYLDLLAQAMRDGGELRLATDDPSYQRWMAIELTRHPAFAWTARRPADWRTRPDDWPPTRYEGKAIEAGRQPVYLRYRRKPRSNGNISG